MSKVKICLGAVFCNVDFAVLIRAHCARIDIDVGIKFLSRNFKSSCLQKATERCGGDAFSETGHNTSCYKYIFRHNILRHNILR